MQGRSTPANTNVLQGTCMEAMNCSSVFLLKVSIFSFKQINHNQKKPNKSVTKYNSYCFLVFIIVFTRYCNLDFICIKNNNCQHFRNRTAKYPRRSPYIRGMVTASACHVAYITGRASIPLFSPTPSSNEGPRQRSTGLSATRSARHMGSARSA